MIFRDAVSSNREGRRNEVPSMLMLDFDVDADAFASPLVERCDAVASPFEEPFRPRTNFMWTPTFIAKVFRMGNRPRQTKPPQEVGFEKLKIPRPRKKKGRSKAESS